MTVIINFHLPGKWYRCCVQICVKAVVGLKKYINVRDLQKDKTDAKQTRRQNRDKNIQWLQQSRLQKISKVRFAELIDKAAVVPLNELVSIL